MDRRGSARLMKSLARQAVASTVAAALLAGSWPVSAWAGDEPSPIEAMRMFHDLGFIKNDADPVKSYLGNNAELTPIGRALFMAMKKRYNQVEEAEALKPAFERLRNAGPYTAARSGNVNRAVHYFNEQFGKISDAAEGSVEESFRTGGLLQAMISGAAISDPPKANAYTQVEVQDGFEFWDREGLAFQMTKNQVTTYNRELQKNQRLMNASRPVEVDLIPETGRYNYEMFQYSYWRLKNQETEYAKAARIDRMIAIAELLGRQYPNDLWFNDPTLEPDLLKAAKDKTYKHHGQTYSVLEIVEAKLKQRYAYLEGAKSAVAHFEADMLKLKGAPTISDAQVQTMSLNEQNALRWLSLSVLETQVFHVRNQRERVDPTSPDAQAIMKMVDESQLSVELKAKYKRQGLVMKERLDELNRILATVRKALNDADYAGSLDMVQAALASTQKELADLSIDYSIYLEAPSTAWLAKKQAYDGYNPLVRLTRGAYGTFSKSYAAHMKAIEGGDGKDAMAKSFTDVATLIASGTREDWVKARASIMAMNPGAAAYAMTGTPGGEAGKVNDALRITASLKAAHEHISAVTEDNKTADAIANMGTWAFSIGLGAPLARGMLSGMGKLSGPGIHLIEKGRSMTYVSGLGVRAVGRGMVIIGDVSKHTAARLATLEPRPGLGGSNPIGSYLVRSGARAANAAARQASFTVLSGSISGAWTA
ncbi:MAG: hypothetical protein HYZ74_04460, partial [Elusimicrobia bacterium]|nr:hypothetical protein [Elusimicrobiota bacterium]